MTLFGVRCPADDFLLEVIKSLGEPIATTSCNLAGEPAMVSLDENLPTFKDKVDAIIDEGPCPEKIPSTIVRFEDDDIIILREGQIDKNDIRRVIRRCLDI